MQAAYETQDCVDSKAEFCILQGNMDIVNESLDNANELLTRFGHIMTDSHAQLRSSLMPVLEDYRPIVRKRAISCLGKAHV